MLRLGKRWQKRVKYKKFLQFFESQNLVTHCHPLSKIHKNDLMLLLSHIAEILSNFHVSINWHLFRQNFVDVSIFCDFCQQIFLENSRPKKIVIKSEPQIIWRRLTPHFVAKELFYLEYAAIFWLKILTSGERWQKWVKHKKFLLLLKSINNLRNEIKITQHKHLWNTRISDTTTKTPLIASHYHSLAVTCFHVIRIGRACCNIVLMILAEECFALHALHLQPMIQLMDSFFVVSTCFCRVHTNITSSLNWLSVLAMLNVSWNVLYSQ